MKSVREFIYPATVEEAVRTLERGAGKARIIAGGTSVSQSRDAGVETLVDITRLDLDRIFVENGSLSIGACATADQIARSDQVHGFGLNALSEAAREVGPAGVRNAVTLGGNVVQCYPWSDMPVALLVFRSEVVTAGPGQRTWPLAELLERHPTKQLGPNDLVTHFRVERPPIGSGSAFVKFGRTAVDYALVSAAAAVQVEKGQGWGEPSTGDDVTWVRAVEVAVGAARSLPVRVSGLDTMTGPDFRPDERWRQRVADAVRDSVKPQADMRASVEYRSALVGVVAARALRRAVERALANLAAF